MLMEHTQHYNDDRQMNVWVFGYNNKVFKNAVSETWSTEDLPAMKSCHF